MARRKKRSRSSPIDDLSRGARGFAGLGMGLAVGSAVTGKAVSQLPAAQQAAMAPVQGSFTTIAGYAPIVATGIGAGAALKAVKGLHKRKKKRRMMY